jgi:hypothetical protein
MTSILKTNIFQDQSGNNIINRASTTVTLGKSGDTVSAASGSTLTTPSLTVNGAAVTGRLFPTISSISPTSISASTPTSVTITGTNFIATPVVEAIESATGAYTRPNSVSFTSSTTISANFTLSNTGTYYIRVENNTGFAGRSATALLTVA